MHTCVFTVYGCICAVDQECLLTFGSCRCALLPLCYSLQGQLLSFFTIAPLPTPVYQHMYYLTKNPLFFNFLSQWVNIIFYRTVFLWAFLAQFSLQFLILESSLNVACFLIFKFSFNFSPLQVKTFVLALSAASSASFAWSKAALPTCASPIRAAQLTFPDCCFDCAVSFFASFPWFLYIRYKTKDFQGLRTSQPFSRQLQQWPSCQGVK